LGSALHHILLIPFNFSPFAIQMWYVYLLIGLYLYLPVFSAWVKQASDKEQQFFLGLWFISLFIPYLREYLTRDLWGTCSWNEFGLLYYFAGFNGYLLLGYYLFNHPQLFSWKTLAIGGIPLFIAGYCITFFGFKSVTAVPGQPVELVELFFTYCTPNVLIMSLPIFLAVQKLPLTPAAVAKPITSLSTCTFGIWMSHYLFLGPCYMLMEHLPVHTMLKLIVCTLLLLTVTWGFVHLVRKSGQWGKWIMG
jgi:surface polysaccharide O-acyltransferase-like enzyme